MGLAVDELIQSAMDYGARYGPFPPDPPPPLTGDEWIAVIDERKREAESRVGRYPPGFVLDDSRETMYREREDAPL